MLLGTPAVSILLGVTFPSVSHAPLPGPGCGLATTLWSLARVSDWLYQLEDAKRGKGCSWGSSLNLAAM